MALKCLKIRSIHLCIPVPVDQMNNYYINLMCDVSIMWVIAHIQALQWSYTYHIVCYVHEYYDHIAMYWTCLYICVCHLAIQVRKAVSFLAFMYAYEHTHTHTPFHKMHIPYAWHKILAGKFLVNLVKWISFTNILCSQIPQYYFPWQNSETIDWPEFCPAIICTMW